MARQRRIGPNERVLWNDALLLWVSRAMLPRSVNTRSGRVVAAVALSWCGCVEARTGTYARPLDASGSVSSSDTTAGGLRISGAVVPELSSEYFGLLELTFENTSASWRRIVSVRASFAEPDVDQHVHVPIGEDLQSWLRGTLEQYDLRTGEHRGALGAAWATLQNAVSGNACIGPSSEVPPPPPPVPSEAAGGPAPARAAVAPSGGAGANTVQSAVAGQRGDGSTSPLNPLTLETANALTGSEPLASALPDTHLMHVPLSIPPGLFTRRFLVIDTSQAQGLPCLHQLLLDIELDDGKRERAWLSFRLPGSTPWQRKECEGG